MPFVFGCIDATAFNYNENANTSNNTCYYNPGGTDSSAFNYDSTADFNDGSCVSIIEGCLDSEACNYNENANTSNDSCVYPAIFYNCQGNCINDGDGDGICDELEVLGCTNPTAFNFEVLATDDDGSCVPFIYGCIDPTALNYDSEANTDDGSCVPFIYGCIDPTALNYDSEANTDDGSCVEVVFGCMNQNALNYNATANEDDGSCILPVYGCTDPTALNYSSEANTDDGSCVPFIYGCINPDALNYDSEANTDDGSCIELVEGCMDENALNYNPLANEDDGSCITVSYGCTNLDAANYDPDATDDDGSCIIYGCTINAWFICPESYNPNATINDWSMCVFTWNGCSGTALAAPDNPDEYPTVRLYELTDDIIDAYYFLGSEKIGCMDKLALNYSKSAILDDESCLYSMVDDVKNQIEVYPQPANSYAVTDFKNSENKEINSFIIHNSIGQTIYTGSVNINEKVNVNTSNWDRGVYYVVIKMENKNITHRFVVE